MNKKIINIVIINQNHYNTIKQYFDNKQYDYFDVNVIYGDILNTSADIIASAGNSYAMMDGGIDGSINCFLDRIESEIKKIIIMKYYGEMPVGTCLLYNVQDRCKKYKYLAYVPTMKVPCNVSDSINAYLSLRSILVQMMNENLNLNSVCIPLFCAGAGEMSIEKICHQYDMALNSIVIDPSKLNWKDIWSTHRQLVNN